MSQYTLCIARLTGMARLKVGKMTLTRGLVSDNLIFAPPRLT